MRFLIPLALFVVLVSCDKDTEVPLLNVGDILIDSAFVNGSPVANNKSISDVDYLSVRVRLKFSTKVDTSRLKKSYIYFTGGIDTAYHYSFSNDSRSLTLVPKKTISPSSSIRLVVDPGKNMGGNITTSYAYTFYTRLDTTPKFPRISDDSLLTLVQKKTFAYFWDYAHPTSGLIRERNGSGDLVTSGGSGFGLMAILTGIGRGFITRQQGFERLQKIANFLAKPATDKFHGAFPHWLNGSTGKVIPFSTKDNGGDLVETAFLMQGLLTVQAYFKDGTVQEQALCDTIDKLWRAVEWDWYRKSNESKLYWHWSPNYTWEMNMPVSGWNEALIVYVLAASSPTHTIPKSVYTSGWARNGAMANGKTFYGITLPLGEDRGGPLFFSHYSFLGLDPRNLSDAYANYWTQTTAHAKINHAYCAANPKAYRGYSSSCWGLTASDIQNGYTASSPNNDVGVIAPTAALSSFPYTPEESMDALHHFYYLLGDKLWGQYGFYDAFNQSTGWTASSYLAIDQGPIICMIENYRSGLLWDLFMSSQDVQNGLTKLGFTY
ncbi:MAG: glucoamylase family protein [Bacteroidales bacterium]